MSFSYNFNKKIKLSGLAPRFKILASRAVSSLLIALIAAIGTILIVRAAPTILATMTDAFVGVHDGDGKADPGETIEYTAVIQNSGADPATGVTFNDIIDLNTTLVDGSLNVSPLAADDTYATIGNTLLEVGVTASGDPAVRVTTPAIDSLFDNDTEFLGDTYTLKSVEADSSTPFTTATESGGSVTVQADGTFSYTPTVGFSGADHFDYVLTDDGPDNILGNADDLTGAGRVTINVNTQRVWYVKNNATAGGTGRSTDPFDTLVEAQTASSANDTIYIFQGDGTTTGQNAGIVLKDGQRLIGEGVDLTVAISLVQQGVGGPNPTPLRLAGSQPRIGNTGGDGVSANNDIPSEIRGLSISGLNNTIDITINDASAGTLQIKDNTIFGAGAEGIDINHGGSATLTLDAQNNTWNTGGTHTGNAFDASANGTGRLALNFSTNTNILSTGASGVVLADTGGTGTLAVTGFANNSVHQNTSLNGISANTVIFDGTPGGTFQTVSGGSATIGTSGDGVGTSGLTLTTVSGDLSFTDLDIVASNGTGLSATSSTAYTGSAGFQIAVGSGATVNATNGPAVSLTTVTASLPFSDIDSTNSTTTGVSLSAVLGSFSAGSGSSITNASTTDFVVSNSNATITYSGSISDTAGAGVNLTTNTGSTITFNGPLSISSGSSAAFSATGGGTVNVCDDNPCNPAATGSVVNTLTSTTGTALNVVSTTIGSSDLEFRSISANGASNGIVLNTTGSSGNLAIKGNGGSCTSAGTCTGGAIQNTTGDGISLTSTSGVSLTRLFVGSTGNHGINTSAVNGLTLTGSYVTNAGNGDNEYGLNLVNPSGTVTIDGTTFNNAADNLVYATHTGPLTFNVSNSSSFSYPSSVSGTANSAILIEPSGSGAATVSIQNSTFTNIVSASAQIGSNTLGANGTHNFTFSNNTISVTLPSRGSGVVVSGQELTTTNITIDNNNFSGAGGNGVISLDTNDTSTIKGTANNNIITNPPGIGIFVAVDEAGKSDVTLNGNTITNSGGDGIQTVNFGGAGVSTMDMTITNNMVNGHSLNTAVNFVGGIAAFALSAPPEAGDSSCVVVRGNTVTATPASPTQCGGAPCVDYYIEETAGVLTFEEAPNTGNTTLNAAYVNSINDAGPVSVFGVIDLTNGATCNITGLGMLPDNDRVLAQNQVETDPIALAPVTSTNLNSANTFTAAFASWKLPEQASEIDPANTAVNASTTIGGGKPLFRGTRLAPALSGETVTVPAFTLPAGKSVTIKFQVTVDNPIDNPVGATQISNQGTVGYDVAQTKLTDDPSIGGISDPTITLIDRPDTTVSSINRHTPSTTPTNATSVIWRVTFANPVAGLTSSNFTLANTGLIAPSITTVSAVTASPDTQWDVTVNTGTGDGTLGLNMTSDAGLSHDVTNLTFTGQVYTLDLTPPTVTMSSAAPNPTNASPITITAQFSETVNNFIATDIVAGNATVGNFIAVDGDTYTFELTSSGQGLVTANIAASVAQDAAGNNNTAATQFSRTFDSVSPTVTMTSAASDPTNANPIPATAQFSENMTGFDAGDITPGNATVGNFVAVDGDTYTFDLTPLSDGLVTADIAAGVATDAAGNGNTAATQFSRTFDSAGPTVTMSSAAPDPTNTSPIPVTTQFSENVTGFDVGDITPGNATVDNFIAVDGDTYTFDLTPSGQGLVTADIAAGVAQDSGGNGNSAATQFSRTFDSAGPTVTMSSAAPDPTNTSPIPVSVQFNENVTGFDMSDITPGNATVGNFIAVDGDTYTFDLTPLADGPVTADIGAGLATDTAGNGNTAAAQFIRTFDSDAPTVAMTSAALNPTNTSPIPVTVQFSENVTGFDVGDITPGNATVGNFIAVDGDTYTFDLTPLADGPVTADIAAGVAQDSGGNLNNAAIQFIRTFDTVAPTMTLNQAVGQADPTSSSPINFTVIFNEPVSGFGDSAADVSLSGTAGATTALVTESAPNDGTTYNVAVSGMSVDGTVIASIPTGSALDAAGNGNTAVSTSTDDTVTFIADAIPPSVTSVNRADPSPTSAASVNFTVTFSESVTGVNTIAPFDDFELTTTGVSGATVSGVSGSGAVYTVTVDTGTGNGTIRLDVLDDDMIIDAASNPLAGGFTSGEVYTIDKSANVEVTIGGSNVGNFSVAPDNSIRQSFAGLNNGPVKVVSANSLDIIAALRVIWQEPGERTSYSEMMGLPKEQLSDEYWFPWYNNLDTAAMTQGLRIANVDATDTTIKVMLGATELDSFTLQGGESVRVSYAVNNGPIQIFSVEGNNIIAALRVIWQEPGERTSYSEMMGLPKEQLSTEYWFPWYNNLDTTSMTQGLRIASVNASGTNTVEVWVGNTMQDSFSLAAGASVRVGYPVNDGPVRIVCTTCSGNEKIISSLRVIWQETGERTSYSEMMGLPLEQLSTEYWFPWYNNFDMNHGLRIANVNATGDNTIQVWVGDTLQDSFDLVVGESVRVSYSVNAGPIRIVCTTCLGNEKILTSLQVIWHETGQSTSYSEMMGLPLEQLSTEYWFPWYNNATSSMAQGFRIGVP